MKIINQFHGTDPAFPEQFLRLNRNGAEDVFDTELLAEHTLDVYIGDMHAMHIVCTPEHLSELVVGRLLTEGFIRSAEDVELIRLCEDGHSARVRRNGSFTDIGCQMTLVPRSFDMEEIFLCAERFAGDTILHARTRSTHSCFLVSGGKIVFECEDMSRHNAVDKAVGWALIHGIDLSDSALFTTGRVPMDMAVKMVRARVPVLISKESATVDAIDFAGRFGLTIIGRVKDKSFVIYNDGARQDAVRTIS